MRFQTIQLSGPRSTSYVKRYSKKERFNKILKDGDEYGIVWNPAVEDQKKRLEFIAQKDPKFLNEILTEAIQQNATDIAISALSILSKLSKDSQSAFEILVNYMRINDLIKVQYLTATYLSTRKGKMYAFEDDSFRREIDVDELVKTLFQTDSIQSFRMPNFSSEEAIKVLDYLGDGNFRNEASVLISLLKAIDFSENPSRKSSEIYDFLNSEKIGAKNRSRIFKTLVREGAKDSSTEEILFSYFYHSTNEDPESESLEEILNYLGLVGIDLEILTAEEIIRLRPLLLKGDVRSFEKELNKIYLSAGLRERRLMELHPGAIQSLAEYVKKIESEGEARRSNEASANTLNPLQKFEVDPSSQNRVEFVEWFKKSPHTFRKEVSEEKLIALIVKDPSMLADLTVANSATMSFYLETESFYEAIKTAKLVPEWEKAWFQILEENPHLAELIDDSLVKKFKLFKGLHALLAACKAKAK